MKASKRPRTSRVSHGVGDQILSPRCILAASCGCRGYLVLVRRPCLSTARAVLLSERRWHEKARQRPSVCVCVWERERERACLQLGLWLCSGACSLHTRQERTTLRSNCGQIATPEPAPTSPLIPLLLLWSINNEKRKTRSQMRLMVEHTRPLHSKRHFQTVERLGRVIQANRAKGKVLKVSDEAGNTDNGSSILECCGRACGSPFVVELPASLGDADLDDAQNPVRFEFFIFNLLSVPNAQIPRLLMSYAQVSQSKQSLRWRRQGRPGSNLAAPYAAVKRTHWIETLPRRQRWTPRPICTDIWRPGLLRVFRRLGTCPFQTGQWMHVCNMKKTSCTASQASKKTMATRISCRAKNNLIKFQCFEYVQCVSHSWLGVMHLIQIAPEFTIDKSAVHTGNVTEASGVEQTHVASTHRYG